MRCCKVGLPDYQVLDYYCLASGQDINQTKSKIYIDYDRVPLSIIQNLKETCDIPFGQDHFFHPSAPIIKGRPELSHFPYILDVVRSKLALWQCKYISFAGRIIIQSAGFLGSLFAEATTREVCKFDHQ